MSVQRAGALVGARPFPIRMKGRPVTSCGTEERVSQRRSVVLAAPEGFRAHRYGEGGGWWFLEWNTTPGVVDYEEDHEFSQGVRRTGGTRGSIFAVPTGDERSSLVRAVGTGGAVSRWVKCTVNWLGRLTIDEGDDPEPPPPGPPPVPVLSQVAGGRGSVTAVWGDHPDALRWDVQLVSSSGAALLTDAADTPQHVFRGLAAETRYGVRVRAVGGGGASSWSAMRWVWTLAEQDPASPPQPKNLAVHCITTSSAQVTWDNDPDVDYWVISVDERPETTYDNGRRLVDLRPGTGYTVTVTAHRGGSTSPAATADFTTLPDEADPEAPLPMPHNVMARAVSATEVEMSWEQAGASTWLASVEPGWQQRVDRRHHGTTVRFGGLVPGATYTAEVYAQQGWDLSPIARQSVTLPKEG